MINTKKLDIELKESNIQFGGCNSNGVVWDTDGITEIQERPDVKRVISSHDPSDVEIPTLEERLQAAEILITLLLEE